MSVSLQTLAIAIPIALVIAAICLGVIFGATWGYRWITPESNCGQCKYEVPAPMPERCPECGTFYHESTLDTPQRRAQRVTGIGRCAISLLVLGAVVWGGVYFAVMAITKADDRYLIRKDQSLRVHRLRDYPVFSGEEAWTYEFVVHAECDGDSRGNIFSGWLTFKLVYKDHEYEGRRYEIPFSSRRAANAGPSDEDVRELFERAGLSEVVGDLAPHLQCARALVNQTGSPPPQVTTPVRFAPGIVLNWSGGSGSEPAPIFGRVCVGLGLFAVVLIGVALWIMGRIQRIRRQDLARLVDRWQQHEAMRQARGA